MVRAFEERHDYVVGRLNAIPGVSCLRADGTFYLFPNVQALVDRLPGVGNDLDLAEYLIEKAGVALVPGTAFGLGGHIRLSIATSMANLEKALDRFAAAVS
jgi:aspartate aminotransferase